MAISAWRDDAHRYGLITRALHWAMAAVFAWQFAGMIAKVTVGRTPATAVLVGSHAGVGTILMVLIVLRLAWAWYGRRHRPPHSRDLIGRAAVAGHVALYVLMFAVPLLALLRTYGSGRAFAPFGIPLMDASERIEWMMAPANAVHGFLGWTMLALIVGHIGMVIVHRVVWRDGVLERMAGPIQRPSASTTSARNA